MLNFLKYSAVFRKDVRNVKDISKRLRLTQLYKRRMDVGPEQPKHRSEFTNWNYKVEIFCFGKRLGEDFDINLLKQAFIDRSYTLNNEDLNVQDNSELRQRGYDLAVNHIRAFLVHRLPDAPDEWIQKIENYLTSEMTVARISGHIGTRDLILTAATEIENEAEFNAFFAIIGALAKSQNTKVAEKFVRDFILADLANQHLCDIINIPNPFQLLKGVLLYHKKDVPISRLLYESGMNSVFACCHIGVYSGSKLIGRGAGENIDLAEKEAFCNALFNLFLGEASLQMSCVDLDSDLPTTEEGRKPISSETYLQWAQNDGTKML